MKSADMRIGSRLELFVDDYLVDRLDGLGRKMHAPQPAPLSPSPVRGAYMTIIKDRDLYRAYYRDQAAGTRPRLGNGDENEITCYAESRDGHRWVHPQLGIYPVSGSQGNNVVLAKAGLCSHNFSPFLDTRPGVPAGERFKALAGVHDRGQGGLYAFASGDGLHWEKVQDGPVIGSDDRAFDSQNVAFWSQSEGCYACCYRSWSTPQGGLRTISRAVSSDFIRWSAQGPVEANVPGEHLYTSNTHPYYRAPHIYIALPTRFLPQHGDSTDILLMTSRGGTRYDRLFMEAFMRPGLDAERWGNRSNYAALNVVPTGPAEMSVYHALSGRRYVLRTDGFVSLHAGSAAGEMVTRCFEFSGRELVLNYSTSAAGSVRIEVQSPGGGALPGYSLADCRPLIGDEIEGAVHWRHGTGVSDLAGKPVRLRYVLQDADVYAMRFRQEPGALGIEARRSMAGSA